jgi:hypothetical protein
MSYLYWLGFGTLIAVMAVGVWQLFAVGRAKQRREHSTMGQHDDRLAAGRSPVAERDRTRQP